MTWIPLTDNDKIDVIKEASFEKPQLIFKHSTRCSISSMAKNRLDRSEQPEGITFHYLDLINHRSISNNIAEIFNVAHESPQVLLIKNGECVYDESHSGISMDEITEQASL
jgi:bacillithiol system protein YtxJ